MTIELTEHQLVLTMWAVAALRKTESANSKAISELHGKLAKTLRDSRVAEFKPPKLTKTRVHNVQGGVA